MLKTAQMISRFFDTEGGFLFWLRENVACSSNRGAAFCRMCNQKSKLRSRPQNWGELQGTRKFRIPQNCGAGFTTVVTYNKKEAGVSAPWVVIG